MKKTFYELYVEKFEMSKSNFKKFRSIEKFYHSQSDFFPELQTRFLTKEEAITEFKKRRYNIPDIMKGIEYPLTGEIRYIEKNTYDIDEDGNEEWIEGGDWIDVSYPIMPEEDEEKEKENEEE